MMTSKASKSSPEVLKTVDLLKNLGLMPLPIKRNTKVTDEEGFSDPSYSSDYNRWKNEDLGVGVVLSERYKLVDIDLDHPDIANLAVSHLPHGGWIFGRKGKKCSHHVFVISDSTDTTQKQRAIDPKAKGYMDTEKIPSCEENPKERSCIIEYRADGGQTVMPGTIHTSGELIEWKDGKVPTKLPAAVDSYELRRAVRKIAFTVMAAKHGWFDGCKHDLSMAYAGMFYLAKWTEDEAVHWMNCFLSYVDEGDDRKKVIRAVRDTYKRAEGKQRIAGGPRLAEITAYPRLVYEFRKLFMDARAAVFEDFNARYAVAVYFGKVCVIDFDVVNDLSLPDFETMPPQEFHMLTCNDRIKLPAGKKDIFVPKSKYWFEHPDRRTYRKTDFMPGEAEVVDGKLNLWRGWQAKPNSKGSIDKWLGHMERFICDYNEEMMHWLMAWLADIVQNPMQKPGTAVMLRSGQRSGKNTFVEMMKCVIGMRHVREMNGAGQITNRYNSNLQYALLMFANEADFASSTVAANVLKTLITDKDFFMDHKWGHAKSGRNYLRVVLASNKIHVLNRDADDQRYTVVDVVNPTDHMTDEEKLEHFRAIYEEIDGDGPGKLLDYLMHYEYSVDLLRSCYQSAAGRKQILMSMDPVAQWWAKCIDAGRIQVPEDHMDQVRPKNGKAVWPTSIGKTALEAAFRDQHKGERGIPSPAFHAMLWKCSGIDPKQATKQIGGRYDRYRAILLPELEEAREALNERYQDAVIDGTPIEDDDMHGSMERTDEMDEF
jgi:hypothetical protein